MMHENLEIVSLKNLLFIAVVAIISSLLIASTNLFFSPTASFIASLVLLAAGMNFSVYLVKKSGTAAVFYFITAALTSWIDDMGILGWKKVLVFFFAGILFESVFLFLKVRIHNVPLDMIIGTGLSSASLPLLIAFTISDGLAGNFPLALVNIILLAFAVGLISSTIAFLIWHEIEHAKFILKLESYLMSLA